MTKQKKGGKKGGVKFAHVMMTLVFLMLLILVGLSATPTFLLLFVPLFGIWVYVLIFHPNELS